jgi:hypothetical protein
MGLGDRVRRLEGGSGVTPDEHERRKWRERTREEAVRLNASFLREAAVERRGELLAEYGTLEVLTEAGIDWSDGALLAEDAPVPPFAVAEDGSVSCSRDGRLVTTFRQTLAEVWYWRQAEGGNPGKLVHDEEEQAFYTPEGDLALSRDRADLRHIFRNL